MNMSPAARVIRKGDTIVWRSYRRKRSGVVARLGSKAEGQEDVVFVYKRDGQTFMVVNRSSIISVTSPTASPNRGDQLMITPSKGISRTHQRTLEDQRAQKIKSVEERAAFLVLKLDAYLEADAAYKAACENCEKLYGHVIYDVIYREQETRDAARKDYVNALVKFKLGDL